MEGSAASYLWWFYQIQILPSRWSGGSSEHLAKKCTIPLVHHFIPRSFSSPYFQTRLCRFMSHVRFRNVKHQRVLMTFAYPTMSPTRWCKGDLETLSYGTAKNERTCNKRESTTKWLLDPNFLPWSPWFSVTFSWQLMWMRPLIVVCIFYIESRLTGKW